MLPADITQQKQPTATMTSMSIKERIRALNLQSGGSAPDSPPRQNHNNNRQIASFATPVPSQSMPLSAAKSSIPEPSSPSPLTKSPLRSSPTSEKAQLFKAAKVIRKAFDAGSGPNFLEPSSPNSRHTADEAEEGDDSFGFDNSAEFDATAALKGWRSKGMAIDEPSLHDVGSHINEMIDNASIIDDDPTTPGIASQLEIQDASADSSLERKACRVAGTRSLANGGETATAYHDTNDELRIRPTDAVSSDGKIGTSLGNDVGELRYESKSSSQYSMSGGGTYRAYARRSRLRSPRSPGTASSDIHNFVDGMDGTQSVTSAQSALSQTSLSQISSLSTRATRFLKDKKDRRKEAAFLTTGGGEAIDRKFDEMAQDIVQNALRGDSKEPILHNAGVDVSKSNESLSNHSSKEWKTGGSMGRPQTIDIRPSIPKLGEYISDLNRDVGYHDQFDAHSNHDERQLTPTYDEFQRIIPMSELKDYPTKDATSQNRCDQTASLDESSCSELKAKDLFDISRKRGSDLKKISAYNRLDGAGSESHSEFTPFQHGVGKSFDTGCNVLESMNPLPLIESALNALSARSQTNGAFFVNASSGVARSTPPDDAPFDEDAIPPDEPIGETVAIEVEYVEHGDEHQSVAETDSIFSVSTRDLESFNA